MASWQDVLGDAGEVLTGLYGEPEQPTTIVVEQPEIPWVWIGAGAVVLLVLVAVLVLASRS